MLIAENEYKIRLVLGYPKEYTTIPAPIYEDRLFSTYFDCLDHLLDIRETIKNNSLWGMLTIVRVERPLQAEEFQSVCHIIGEAESDWYLDDFFDENEEDMDYVHEEEDNGCREFLRCAAESVGKGLNDTPEFGEIRINEIKFVVALYVYDQQKNQVWSGIFNSFTELNEFIEANEDKYKGCSMDYCLSEYTDGQTAGGEMIMSGKFGKISMRDICYTVYDETDQVYLWRSHHAKPEKIVVYRERTGYTELAAEEDQTLVCDACFRPADECTCEKKALYVVPIDTKYIPIIRELNEKGYRTEFCCAGHEREMKSGNLSPNLIFRYEFNFDVPLPDEYVYFRNKCEIRLRDDESIPDGSDMDACRAYHDRITEDLAEWVHKLPEIGKIEYREYPDWINM